MLVQRAAWEGPRWTRAVGDRLARPFREADLSCRASFACRSGPWVHLIHLASLLAKWVRPSGQQDKPKAPRLAPIESRSLTASCEHECRLSNKPSAFSATQMDYRISLLLRFARWYCVRIRAEETFAVEVDHVVGIFGYPNFRFPCYVR